MNDTKVIYPPKTKIAVCTIGTITVYFVCECEKTHHFKRAALYEPFVVTPCGLSVALLASNK